MSCRKPYNPPAINAPGSYLVVEGVINAGSDSTTIMLSKTVSLSSTPTVAPVTGAIVTVLRDDNISYPLAETGNGNYASPGLNLDNTHQYRLNIKTTDGQQYQSDPEPVLITPPIDSVGFNIVSQPSTGIQIYANTHDPSGAVKYYRWSYTENWEFNAYYPSSYISNGTAIVPRTLGQQVSPCYSSDVSSNIVLGSSAKLSQAVINHSPITFLSSTSEKIEDRYRILVNQYALSGDAYSFWESLRTNTEQLGSIFDAQPSTSPGNIHCVNNPAEPVLGYISVCTVTTRTLFLYNYNLPAWVPTYPYQCEQDTAYFGTGNYIALVEGTTSELATSQLTKQGVVVGYLFSSPPCADCTIRGTINPPPFWQ